MEQFRKTEFDKYQQYWWGNSVTCPINVYLHILERKFLLRRALLPITKQHLDLPAYGTPSSQQHQKCIRNLFW